MISARPVAVGTCVFLVKTYHCLYKVLAGKSLVEISIYIEYIVIVELRVVTGRACSCVLFQCHFWSLLVGVGQRCSTCTFAVAAEGGVCFDLPYILQQVDGSGKRGGKVTSVVDGTSSIL